MAGSGTGVWAWDLATDQLTWSPETFALFGCDPAAGPPTRAAWRSRVHPPDLRGADQDVRTAISSRSTFATEYRIAHPDRGVRWLAEVGAVQWADDGAAVRLSGLVHDVTDRRMREGALRDADRRKDEFIATLAHELRNPLAPIRTGIAVLRRAPRPEVATATVAMIERQLAQVVHLVDDLLDVTRVRTGKLVLRKEPLDVAQAIDAAIEATRPQMEPGAHVVEVHLPPTPLVVSVDRGRFVQILSNLLANAAKFSDPGGRITITGERRGHEVVIQVRDHGIGIPRDVLPEIWELFAQAGRGQTSGGLGLGLALVRRLVELHGGTVEGRSDGPGLGSTFEIRLPATRSAPPTVSPPSLPPTRLRPQRILVVDDNVDSAHALALLLGDAGHDVRTAHDGLLALSAAAELRPDVVLLDIGLPGIDGYEVARRIRRDSDLAQAVLVALTSRGSDSDRILARDAGFDHHFTKPVEPDELEHVLAGFARRR